MRYRDEPGFSTTVPQLRGSIQERRPGTWRIRMDTVPDPFTKMRRQINLQIRGTREDALLELEKLQSQARPKREYQYFAPFKELGNIDYTIAFLTAQLDQLKQDRAVITQSWRALILVLRTVLSKKEKEQYDPRESGPA